ncbi:putative Rho-type GTPase-activating protein 4 [Zancudomyces culisetae]|nr:putative Rho-type GTPase-activating protein 4 [Zancudomyces culisetae]|eukprot:OMH81617.1 putative Rho-type GTPase-activating protein 4 [Zancudomyces culisetae]
MLARQQEKLRGRQKELPEIPEGTKEPEVKQSSKRELGVGLRVGTDADRDQRVRSREHKDRSNVETRRLTKEIERLKEELKEAYEKIAELQTENARLKSGASITNTSSTTTVAATGNVERKNTVIKKDGKDGHVIQISKKAEMFFGGVHAHAYQGFSSLRPVRCDHCGELVWGINGKDLRCRLCTYTVHQRCLSNDTSKCTGPVQASGGRSAPGRGAEVEDNKAADASFAPDAMFTRSLEKQVELEHASDGVPWIVHKSLEFIETYGADMEGIYRKSGSTSDIRTVHNRISLLVKQRRLDEPIAPADMDVASVTSVLKQYFRDLPNPLLTSELYRSWIHASSIEVTEQEKIIWYRQVALSMPPAHFLTMLTLLRHLNKISSLSSVNLMTPVNLSVVFAPNLLRLPSNHLGLEMLDISAVNVCITFLITRVDAIWPSDSTKLPSLSFPPLPLSASNASLVSSDSAHAESSDFQPISPLSPTFPTSLSGNAFAIP